MKSCKERVGPSLERTIEDLTLLWAGYIEDDCPQCNGLGIDAQDKDCDFCEGTGRTPESIPDLGTLWEYGLCFDYVARDTFTDQEGPYFRYQLSYGGPSTEFRFFVDIDRVPYKIEYWFLDWFDGAHIVLDGQNLVLMEEIFGQFDELGLVDTS